MMYRFVATVIEFTVGVGLVWVVRETSGVNGRKVYSVRFVCGRGLASSVSGNCELIFCSSRRRHTRCACDWSSDVCSSDLFFVGAGGFGERQFFADDWAKRAVFEAGNEAGVDFRFLRGGDGPKREAASGGAAQHQVARSEERRVGKECRSRWSPDH